MQVEVTVQTGKTGCSKECLDVTNHKGIRSSNLHTFQHNGMYLEEKSNDQDTPKAHRSSIKSSNWSPSVEEGRRAKPAANVPAPMETAQSFIKVVIWFTSPLS